MKVLEHDFSSMHKELSVVGGGYDDCLCGSNTGIGRSALGYPVVKPVARPVHAVALRCQGDDDHLGATLYGLWALCGHILDHPEFHFVVDNFKSRGSRPP